jgi:hypothetical protein
MRRTIPTLAVTALALASAAFGTQAATMAGTVTASPAASTGATTTAGGSVLGNPNHTTIAPLTAIPQANQDAGAFSPANPNTVSSNPAQSATAGTDTSVANTTGPAATNVTTDTTSTNASQAPFGTGSTFANDNINAETGTTPGFATSAGTLGSESSTATVGPNGSTAATIGANGTTTGVIAPLDVMGGGIAYGIGGTGAAPGYSGGGASANAVVPATTPTPLLNQVTVSEINKEARQRAQGREPRVIGIAPRTSVDRTNQMPDDPIIRY